MTGPLCTDTHSLIDTLNENSISAIHSIHLAEIIKTIGTTLINWTVMHVVGMLRVGERRLVMLTMLQMEGKLAKGDDPSLNNKVCL